MMSGGSRSAAGPVADKHLAGLIRPVVAAAGMDLESLRVSVAGRRRVLRVIVDSDEGVSLDDAALVSRDISAALDASDVMGNVPYTLEVSSPGVDRPLTEPRHWRRAAGRLVKVKAAAEGTVAGRVEAADDDGVTLEISGTRRRFGYGELGPGAVQVEFGKLPGQELDDFDDRSDDGVPGEMLPDEADLGAGGDGH
jgi:ribosome maturation factor RimP